MSKLTDEWLTPDYILDQVCAYGPIWCDPCTTFDNPTGAYRILTKECCGLDKMWSQGGLTFINPPYSAMKEWAPAIVAHYKLGWPGSMIALVKSDHSVKWWWQLQPYVSAIAYYRRRVRFVDANGGPSTGAKFASCALYFGRDPRRFHAAFHGEHAEVVIR